MEEAHGGVECSTAPAFEGIEISCTVGDGVGYLELVVAAHTGSKERLRASCMVVSVTRSALSACPLRKFLRPMLVEVVLCAFGQGCGVVVLRYDDVEIP